jgi:hypothetical protein
MKVEVGLKRDEPFSRLGFPVTKSTSPGFKQFLTALSSLYTLPLGIFKSIVFKSLQLFSAAEEHERVAMYQLVYFVIVA